jgi:hypothetical protein
MSRCTIIPDFRLEGRFDFRKQRSGQGSRPFAVLMARVLSTVTCHRAGANCAGASHYQKAMNSNSRKHHLRSGPEAGRPQQWLTAFREAL